MQLQNRRLTGTPQKNQRLSFVAGASTAMLMTFAAICISQCVSAQEVNIPSANTNYGSPTYVVIAGARAQAIQAKRSPFEHPPIATKPATPYAYGWFGAEPTNQWSRQFGAQRRYTQWSR